MSDARSEAVAVLVAAGIDGWKAGVWIACLPKDTPPVAWAERYVSVRDSVSSDSVLAELLRRSG